MTEQGTVDDSENPHDARELHRVVVFGLSDDPHDLRDLLVEQLGLSPTDAQIHVHALPGLLPDRLPAHDAAELAAAIRSLGVNAMAISDCDVPRLDRSETPHHLRCLKDGLEIINLRGSRDSLIPWDDLLLLSVGVVPQPPPHHAEAPRMLFVKAGTHQQGSETSLTATTAPEAMLVVANPLRAIQIHHAQMNYEYLGDRLTASATNNFRCLVHDLRSAAPKAWLTPATRAFVDHGLFRHYEFHSIEELRRYTLFHLLVRNAHLHSGGIDDSPDDAGGSAVPSVSREPDASTNQ